MTAFDRAWDRVKEDEKPDDEFHELSETGPRGFRAAMLNNPRIMDMIGEQGENLASMNPTIHECKNCGKKTEIDYFDVYDDDYCSRNCAEGNNPTCRDHGGECQWEIEDMPRYDSSYSDREIKQYQMSVICPVCNDRKWGWVS